MHACAQRKFSYMRAQLRTGSVSRESSAGIYVPVPVLAVPSVVLQL